MSDEIRVFEDGVEQGSHDTTKASSWRGIMVGVGIGLGLGVLLLTSGAPGDGDGSPTTPESPISGVELFESELGIQEVLSGFSDAIVAVAVGEGGSLQHVLWPADKPAISRALPGGTFGVAEFDASGTWVATATEVPDSEGFLLSLGKSSSVKPIASDVSSFAWHDSEEGLLSYTQATEGGWELWYARGAAAPEKLFEASGEEGRVVAWGAWGWAIYRLQAIETLMLDDQLEEVSTIQGRVVATTSDTFLVIGEEGLRLFDHDGTMLPFSDSWKAPGAIREAMLSPDESLLAILTDEGLRVVPVTEEGGVLDVTVSPGVPQLAWSSDSRYVLVPAPRGVVAVDTSDGVWEQILDDQVVREIGVIALNNG